MDGKWLGWYYTGQDFYLRTFKCRLTTFTCFIFSDHAKFQILTTLDESTIHIFPQIRSEFVQNSHYEIRQIDENSFVVLGSPLEWEGRNVK